MFVSSLWPFFFFVEHGAMNRTCSVLLKIRTCRKLDAECYYAVIPFFWRSGQKFCIHFGSSVAALVLIALDFCGIQDR